MSSEIDRNTERKSPQCHPERRYWAIGLCRPCYSKGYGAAYEEAHREERAAARRARRDARGKFLAVAKGGPCTDCGVAYPPYVMDFDHVRGVKAFSVARGINRRMTVVNAEIEKCDLVCSNCHRERTYGKG